MGQVFKNEKNGTWTIRYDLPNSTREKRKLKQIGGFSKKKEAEEALKQLESKVITGDYVSESSLTLEKMLEIWMRDHVRLKLQPKTILFYQRYIDEYIVPELGKMRLSDIKENHIDAFYSKLKRKPDIANKCHDTLRACMNKAWKWKYINRNKNFMDFVDEPKIIRRKRDTLNEEEIKTVLSEFSTHSVHWHVLLALNLGLREGEICGLKESDINYKKKEISILRVVQRVADKSQKIPKNESSIRTLPLPEHMEPIFRQRSKWISANKLMLGPRYNHEWDGFLSVDYKGDIIDDEKLCSRYRDKYKRIMKLYPDITRVTFHDLRHSCASLLLKNGATMKEVQEILGHKNMSTTSDIYAHVDMDSKKGALERVSVHIMHTSVHKI